MREEGHSCEWLKLSCENGGIPRAAALVAYDNKLLTSETKTTTRTQRTEDRGQRSTAQAKVRDGASGAVCPHRLYNVLPQYSTIEIDVGIGYSVMTFRQDIREDLPAWFGVWQCISL